MLDVHKAKHRTIDIDGLTLFYREAGREDAPAVLLIHGFPSSSYSFRNVIGPLAEVARVVAPDMPGFGFTQVPDDYGYSFANMAASIDALTRALGIDRCFLYVYDFGAPVAYHLALARPERVLGLIIQNGNCHEEGLGAQWEPNKAYWADPTPENRAKLQDWLNFEGMRNEYVGGIPERLKPLFAPESWHLDWARMSRPGGVDIQFRIFESYGDYVARFPEISAYHREHQPPALLLWGRHDVYYEIEEILAYHRELERLEMHVFDSGHEMLETHPQECAALMREFVLNVMGPGPEGSSAEKL
ncbi:alpha/beta fold hydrolase [Sphingomonas sp. MS122]|uniref:alpha/beta fold hydrolase n=1 Tax=Sphingomonas sp. MS122 TaxID=3412683 RepID=UPI003C2F3D53